MSWAPSTSVPAFVLPEHLLESRGLRIRRDESGSLAADASLFEIVADFERPRDSRKAGSLRLESDRNGEALHVPLSTLNQKIKRLNIEIRKRGQ